MSRNVDGIKEYLARASGPAATQSDAPDWRTTVKDIKGPTKKSPTKKSGSGFLATAKSLAGQPIGGFTEQYVAGAFDAVGQFEKGKAIANWAQETFPQRYPDLTDDLGNPRWGLLGYALPEVGLRSALPSLGTSAAATWGGAKLGASTGSPHAALIGGFGGLIGSMLLPLYGEARREIYEKTGEDRPGVAAMPTAANLGLEFGLELAIYRKLGLTPALQKALTDHGKEAVKRGWTRVVKEAGKFTGNVAVREAAIESGQWASIEATVRLLNDESLTKFDLEDKKELVNSALMGALGGTGMGAGVGTYAAIRDNRQRQEVQEEIDAIDRILDELKPDAPVVDRQGQQRQAAEQVIREAAARTDQPVTPTEQAAATPTETDQPTATPEEVAPPAPVQEGSSQQQQQQTTPEDLLPRLLKANQEMLASVRTLMNNLPESDRNMLFDVLAQKRAALQELLQDNINMMEEEGFGLDRDGVPNIMDVSQEEYFAHSLSQDTNLDKLEYRGEGNVSLGLLGAAESAGKVIEANVTPQGWTFATGPYQDRSGPFSVTVSQGFQEFTGDSFGPVKNAISDFQSTVQALDSLLNLEQYGLSRVKLFVTKKPRGQAGMILQGDSLIIALKPKESDVYGQTLQALMHEFAHGVVGAALRALPTEARLALRATHIDTLHKAIQQEWTVKDYLDRYMPLTAPTLSKTQSQTLISQLVFLEGSQNDILRDYYLSLNEFAAEQIRLALTRDFIKLSPELKVLSDKTQRILMRAFRSQKKQPEAVPTFRQFLDFALLKGAEYELTLRMEQIAKNVKEGVEIKPQDVKAEQQQGPALPDDVSPVSLLLSRLGRKEDAENVHNHQTLFTGFLGDNVIGTVARKALTPIQIADQLAKKGWNYGRRYMDEVQVWWNKKMVVVQQADEVMRNWRALGGDGERRVSQMLFIVSEKSDEFGRRLSPTELQEVVDKIGLTKDEFEAWQQIDGSFQNTLERIQSGLVYDVAKTYIPDKARAKQFRDEYLAAETLEQREALFVDYMETSIYNFEQGNDSLVHPFWSELSRVDNQVFAMRNKNYFPRSRMGEYAIAVKAREKGAEFDGVIATKENETLAFYGFDSAAEQKAFLETLPKSARLHIRAYKMDSTVFAASSMPTGIINQIKRELPNLTDEQLRQLDDIAIERSPGKRFLRHLTKRRGVKGYSDDALRTYARYMSNASSHLARVEHAADIANVISEMDADIKQRDGVTNDLNVAKDYFDKHFDYIMNPDNDWATLRAIGFQWYLGFNVKSAVINMAQIPMVTFPVLSEHTSSANAVKQIGGAIRDMANHVRGKSNLTAQELDVIDQMVKSGIIDESMVSELAGLGEAQVLDRMLPGYSFKRMTQKVSWVGGAMFRTTEKANRYITALAAARVGIQNGLTGQELVTFTRDMLQRSQFEYAKFNRAEFMRGKKSFMFLFWQYMQHATYLLFGGAGKRTATRMWLMALVIGGMEGLPFAELLLRLVNFSGTQVKKALGVSNPRVHIQDDIRELLLEITDTPDAILKGSSYFWGLGPFHALSALGAPMPELSTRGSLNYGNPIQWFDPAMDPTMTDSDRMLGKVVANMLGPVGGMALSVIEATMSDDPDDWRRWEKVLPTFMQNASTGVRWLDRDRETSKDGATIVGFETPEQRAEAVFKALGFQPTRLDQTRQQLRASQMAVAFYETRRRLLLQDLNYAYYINSREGIADALKAIREYNASLAQDPKLRPLQIQGRTLRESVKNRRKNVAWKDAGIQYGKNELQLQREFERLYPVKGDRNVR